MSKQTEALKLALDGAANYIDALGGDSRKYRQALAEQPAQQINPETRTKDGLKYSPNYVAGYNDGLKAVQQQEPVAWMNILEDGYKCLTHNPIPNWTPLYTSPQAQPQQKPVAKDNSNYRLDPPGLDPRYTSPPAQQEPVAEVVMAAKPPNASLAWLPFKIVHASLEWLDSVPVGTKLYKSPPAQPQQEPVAWRVKVETKLRDGSVDFGYQLRNERLSKYDEPLYTSPPAQRKPLTKTKVGNFLRRHAHGEVSMYRNGFKDGVAFAEAAHGIKGDA